MLKILSGTSHRALARMDDLNGFLRGANRDDFSLIVGATAILARVKYVITLDTDTELPRDAARQFIGAMAQFAAINSTQSAVDILINNGNGTFKPFYTIGVPPAARSVTVTVWLIGGSL